MPKPIKRILIFATMCAGGWILMYGLGLALYHSATWFADSFAKSVIAEQDKRIKQIPGGF